MFKHQGKSRTLKHNILIASVLTFVAGLVNVTGFLTFSQLATHVTGHFSMLINNAASLNFWKFIRYLFYIFSYFFGSFLSSFLILKFKESVKLNAFILPVLLECFILISIAIISDVTKVEFADVIICFLLFAMGLQNALVTKISNAVVRTTHLTGLFTDLGIEVSQLFFKNFYPERGKIKANIKLRIYIISFFFIGGITGSFFYTNLNLGINTLILAASILLISLFYNHNYNYARLRRK